MFDENYETKLNTWNFRRLLSQKYDVVATNPPYMGNNNLNSKMQNYITRYFESYKHDLYCVMLGRCCQLISQFGYLAMITQQSFMFNSRYEKARIALLEKCRFGSLLHLGANAFEEINGEVVQTCSFVLSASRIKDYNSAFLDLQDFGSEVKKENGYLEVVKDTISERYYSRNIEHFRKIEGANFAYWLSDRTLELLISERKLSSIAETRHGLVCGDGKLFMRYWSEVGIDGIGFGVAPIPFELRLDHKWFPYNKGGQMRRWYGNNIFVINWENDGEAIRNHKDDDGKIKSSNYNQEYNLREQITWTDLTTGLFSARYSPTGFLFDTSGPSLFCDHENINYLVGLLNSRVMQKFISLFCIGLHYSPGSVGRIPIIVDNHMRENIEQSVAICINNSRKDYDSFEISWDFASHPLIRGQRTVAASFDSWKLEAAERFNLIKVNEEKLNRIFIDIYGLQDELTPEVEDKDVTVRRADLRREIRSLISFAVGCMFGRYSLDCEGLVYAGGEWNRGNYKTFIADKDNILPICDDEYFDDDITGRFVDFIKAVYGEDNLEENLKFISDVLGGKGSSREIIRNYFINSFFKDHCNMYNVKGSGKRPIYWLFDSGKKNGFKALIYMHRYSQDLLAKLRTDYVHEQQERYRTQLSHIANTLNTASGAERAKLLKQQDKLTEQLREITVFEEKVHHLADQNIAIDLDDGVKNNYKIFADVLAKI